MGSQRVERDGGGGQNRPVHVRYVQREQIDAEKVAEVLIRIALRAAGNGTTTGNTGSYLRDLLTPAR